MITGIYKILNLNNNKSYVGSAVNFIDRKRLHIKMLNEKRHHSKKLQRAWNKYGAHSFEFLVLEITEKENLRLREQYWIDKLNSYFSGYNATPCAHNMLGFKHSQKTKNRISSIQIGKTSCRKGAKLSDETKLKLRLANLGKKLPISTIEKMRRRKFVMSDTAKRNISIARGSNLTYKILFENGEIRQMNLIKDFCASNNIVFKILHQWSIKNYENNRVHPKYGVKLLSLNGHALGSMRVMK